MEVETLALSSGLSLWLRVIKKQPPPPNLRRPRSLAVRARDLLVLRLQPQLPWLGAHALHFVLEPVKTSSLLSFATIKHDDNIPSGPPSIFSKETDYLTY
jgi:hypothetical protein